MYHYKARTYSPTLGRFMQTDPIGYGDGMNWYNYVGGDPVNGTDPSGLACGTLVDVKVGGVDYTSPGCFGYTGLSTDREPKERGSGKPQPQPGGTTTYTRDVYDDGSKGAWMFKAFAPDPVGAFTGGGAATQNGNDDGFCAANPQSCFTVTAAQRTHVPMMDLPASAVQVLAGRVFDKNGTLSALNLPGYKVVKGARGGDFFFVPPTWDGSLKNVVRVQGPGTGSAQHNPGGYYTVYNAGGQVPSPYTGRTVPPSHPDYHNPLGAALPWFP